MVLGSSKELIDDSASSFRTPSVSTLSEKIHERDSSTICINKDIEGGREAKMLSPEKNGIVAELVGFEGPEKMLEVDFIPGVGIEKGLRSLSRSVWENVLNLARCQILSECSNRFYDAYVLSESSLFVADYKMFLKTCGTTTLLRCLPLLLEETKKYGMVLEWLGYSRKNFTFPSDQTFPHCSFSQELEYTKRCVDPYGEQINGGAYMLGDLCKDHFYVYVADYCERSCTESLDRNINIMMYDLSEDVQKVFYKSKQSNEEDARRARKESGITSLIPKAIIDDYMFDPCGYSMNGLQEDGYYTIHVTPEKNFSYASFETNVKAENYRNLVAGVLEIFKPQRFTMTVFADAGAFKTMEKSPTHWSSVAGFKRVSRSSTCFKVDYVCQLANYVYNKENQYNETPEEEKDPFAKAEFLDNQ